MFLAFGRILADKHIVVFVIRMYKTVVFGKIGTEGTDLVSISRTVRNGADRFKIMEYAFGRKFFKHNKKSSA